MNLLQIKIGLLMAQYLTFENTVGALRGPLLKNLWAIIIVIITFFQNDINFSSKL